jgi:RNA polymerase sigma-70 factor, ECF subfamily
MSAFDQPQSRVSLKRALGGTNAKGLRLLCTHSQAAACASVHGELLPLNQEGKMLALETDDALSASSEADREAQFEAELIGLLPFLRAFSLRVSRDRPLSEDLAQDVLAKAWKARASYQYGTNLKAWLCAILRNEYGTHRRRAWRQVPWDADAAETIHAPRGEQRWASELTDIQRALCRVPVEQREALVLVRVAGFSYEEAARITDTPVGTVKSRVSRARASLERIFEQNEPLPPRRPSSEGSALEEFLAHVIALVPA